LSSWWIQWLAIASGGAIGGALRHVVSNRVARRTGEKFQWGTLVVNTSGAMALGFLLGSQGSLHMMGGNLWLLLGVGVLGSYTTASSLSLQTLLMVRGREYRAATGYVLLSLVAGVAACFAGACLGSLA
jgi:CrcB protein